MIDLTGYLIFWVVAFLIFAIAEAVTVRLTAIWFAVGSLAAFMSVLMEIPFWMQLLLFLLVSLLFLLITRPFQKRFLAGSCQTASVSDMIGCTGTVTEQINNDEIKGRVRIGELDWLARSHDGCLLDAGEQVVVRSVEGISVVVARKAK